MKLYELKHRNEHNTSCDVYSLTKRLYPDFQFTTFTGKTPARTKNARNVQLQVIMLHAQTKKDYLSDRK